MPCGYRHGLQLVIQHVYTVLCGAKVRSSWAKSPSGFGGRLLLPFRQQHLPLAQRDRTHWLLQRRRIDKVWHRQAVLQVARRLSFRYWLVVQPQGVELCLQIRLVDLVGDTIRPAERFLDFVGLLDEVFHIVVYALNTSACTLSVVGWRQTSILSMLIPLYCFFIALLACCIASTVAIVFLRFSVVIAACSMFHVCCCSCMSWSSYIRFCLSVRSARCWIAFCSSFSHRR